MKEIYNKKLAAGLGLLVFLLGVLPVFASTTVPPSQTGVDNNVFFNFNGDDRAKIFFNDQLNSVNDSCTDTGTGFQCDLDTTGGAGAYHFVLCSARVGSDVGYDGYVSGCAGGGNTLVFDYSYNYVNPPFSKKNALPIAAGAVNDISAYVDSYAPLIIEILIALNVIAFALIMIKRHISGKKF